jgi:uncharacterized membrane protein YfcA
MEILGALLAGSFIGAVLGFVGAGGAMLSVPILMYLFDFEPKLATTAALAVVFLASLSGVIPKARNKQVLYRDAFAISGIGLVTNFGFASIARHIPDAFITTGFSTVLFIAGLSMLRTTKLDTHKRMPVPVLILTSLAIGSMTGLFGIGGGFLAIPVLVLFFHTPQNKAAGTSLLIIALNCLTAFIAKSSLWSEIDWHYPVIMAVAAVVIARVTSHSAPKAPTIHLKRGFAFLLFTLAAFTILTELLASKTI